MDFNLCKSVVEEYQRACEITGKYGSPFKHHKCEDFVHRDFTKVVESMSDRKISAILRNKEPITDKNRELLKYDIYEMLDTEDLERYVTKLYEYVTKMENCAEKREMHYQSCIKTKIQFKKEEEKHKWWRENYTAAAQDCREKLEYWQRVLESRDYYKSKMLRAAFEVLKNKSQ